MSTISIPSAPSGADARDPEARIRALLDPGGLEVLGRADDGGVLAATGRVGRTGVVAFASDPKVRGGAMSRCGCDVIVRAYERALTARLPIVGLWHSGGARLDQGVGSLHAVGRVFEAMTRASGRVPQISVVLGPAAGGAAYGPALTDLVVLAPEGRIFVTGPDVIRSAIGEKVGPEDIGGQHAHGARSGVAHVTPSGAAEAVACARRLVTLLGDQGTADPRGVEPRPLDAVLPESAARAYDVHPLVDELLDEPGIELQPAWAPSMVVSLGRLAGRTVGVLANNPLRRGGTLDMRSAEKAARFVRMCDAFGVPLITLVDVPGYLPGSTQEWGGVVRRGAKLLHAFAEAVVPRVSLITRKAYGGAYIAMNARSLGAQRVFAWPTAEIAVMHPLTAVRILHRRRLAEVPEPERPALERALAAEQEARAGGVAAAVAEGVVDEVIAPIETRRRIAEAIDVLPAVRGRHGNIPL